MIKSLAVSFVLVFAFSFDHVVAQNSADQLYQAVVQLQFKLGTGEQADQIRDQLGLRQLEAEAAKGFLANPVILNNILGTLQTLPEADKKYAALIGSLQTHLKSMQRSDRDFLEHVAEISGELELVTVEAIDATRQRLVKTLKALDEFNKSELSYYGRHYLNKRLELPALIKDLGELDFKPPAEQADLANYIGQLARFRNRLIQAQDRFGLAATEYGNIYLARSEVEINRMERQLFAFLLPRAARTFSAVKNELAKRARVFRDPPGNPANPYGRLFQAELGRWLAIYGQRDQKGDFAALARQMFSKPNLKITVREEFVNQMASQPVSEVAHVDQVILGSRAQGWSYTNGSVNLDFIDDPHSARISVALSGSVVSNTYTKEGRVTAYTSANGGIYASRGLVASVGSISVGRPTASARVSSQFLGTNCIGLVERIARGRYQERRQRADQIASQRAQAQVLERFTRQSDEALQQGLEQADTLKNRRGELIDELNKFRKDFSEILAEDEQGVIQRPVKLVDPFILPRISVKTTHNELQIFGLLEGDNRLAAWSDPPPAIAPVDVRLQIHESMASNAIAPLIQGQLIQNWQFARIADGLTSGEVEFPTPADDKRFAIQFMDGRPIQVEFEDNEIAVTVFGEQFRRDADRFRDPIMINIRFRVVNDQGKLKLVRSGKAKAEFAIPAKPGELPPESIAFREFLQGNLDEAMKTDPLEEAIELPPNLLPLDFVEEPEIRERLKNALLVEFTTGGGWLTAGWNYLPPGVGETLQTINTPAIWDVSSIKPSDDEKRP